MRLAFSCVSPSADASVFCCNNGTLLVFAFVSSSHVRVFYSGGSVLSRFHVPSQLTSAMKARTTIHLFVEGQDMIATAVTVTHQATDSAVIVDANANAQLYVAAAGSLSVLIIKRERMNSEEFTTSVAENMAAFKEMDFRPLFDADLSDLKEELMNLLNRCGQSTFDRGDAMVGRVRCSVGRARQCTEKYREVQSSRVR